ncbi:MAG: HAMP domain-containing sensor histidine kinase [bacterium]|nr:HAMP domain-containing sensor histidine kinase [bacterium]
MASMDVLHNLDLLAVGVVIATTVLLGFAAYASNTSHATNRMFFFFAAITAAWGTINYFSYQFTDPNVTLWLLRGIMFFAVWQAFFLHQLFEVFPDDSYVFSVRNSKVITPLVAFTALLTLTPAVFQNVLGATQAGVVSYVRPGWGIAVFGIVAVGLVMRAIYMLVVKTISVSNARERRDYDIILAGVAITFTLIITFSFIFATVFATPDYVMYGAVFMLPLVTAIAYTILRHRIFNVKVGATALLVCTLAIASFLEIVFADEMAVVLFRSGVFLLIVISGVMLIRGVLREVRLREEVQRLSEQKSEFMSFASHEIRNPITVMRGYASLILDGSGGEVSEGARAMARKILIEGTTVLDLISQYLSKSKIELGQLKYESESFDLAALVDSAIDSYIPHAQENGLTLNKEIDLSHPLTVVGDKGKIKEVIGNLIDNAIKYTKEGRVTVAVERHGVAVRIIVSDTGAGIEQKTMRHLFKKFARADASKMNLLGTGLGLYLAKTFIETQGGRVWAESEGEGKGSRFIVELPAAPAR